MSNKGFTLVELLSVIVLIGLLLGLAVPGINRISSNMKKKSYNTKINLIEQAAILWGQDNKTRLQKDNNCYANIPKCYKKSIKDLVDDGYLDGDNNDKKVVNPENNINLYDMGYCFVYVYKKNNRVYAKFDKEQKNIPYSSYIKSCENNGN